MVRFATDPDTAHTLDETRAFRGAHVAIFEDDDKGTALKALVPSLSWMVADGAPALPFGEVADFMLRVMTWQAADRATQRPPRPSIAHSTAAGSSGGTGRCSACTQLTSLKGMRKGMTLAAASGFMSLSIPAAAFAL